MDVTLLTSTLLALLFGVISGVIVKSFFDSKSVSNVKKHTIQILESTKKDAERKSKELILDTKKEIYELKAKADKDIKERTKSISSLEDRLTKREERLDVRALNIDRREQSIDSKEKNLANKNLQLKEQTNKIEKLVAEGERKLLEIASLSKEEAQKIILAKVEKEMDQEIGQYIKEREHEANLVVEKKSKVLLANSILQYANDATQEKTVSVVNLPDDNMKGRIIGREGRNIRAIESLTGIDLIIDDTPEAVVLSGFDPVRREIAKRTLNTLVADGRIHPGHIEEIVEKSRKEVEDEMREAGEEAVFETGIGRLHPDLIRLLGKLKYRTSYGQNVLKHSIEVAFFAGKLAAEIGENELLARRAGLLHDIGKAVDHEIDGSHVEIGIDICKKYKEKPEVLNAIGSHHGNEDFKSVIAILVTAADKLSAARPGARSETIENYIKRLEQLEEISNSKEGVDKSYAIQAGREIRVIVKPDQIDDAKAHKIAREIKTEIEDNMSYPGTIKVTVVRETRAVDIAK